jgi:hypothetical protein
VDRIPFPLCLHRIGRVLPQFGQPVHFRLQNGSDLLGSRKRPLFPGSTPGGIAAFFGWPEFTGVKGGQAWQSDERNG